MKEPLIDRLILMTEEQAIAKHLDYRNSRRLTLFNLGFTAYGLIACLIYQSAAGPVLPMILCGGIVFLNLALFIVRNRPDFENAFKNILIIYLLTMFCLLMLTRSSWSSISWWIFLYPFLLLPFRLGRREESLLYGAVILAGVLDTFLPISNWSRIWYPFVAIPMLLICNGFCWFLAGRFSQDCIEAFQKVWWDERHRRERLRMKKELDHASDIQLSMLPPGDPEFEGLDMSCLCLPATEVGGDYYEYFAEDQNLLHVMIGDVSGHGVASGLVLSGVRSCLYMLKDQFPSPGPLLEKLNRMLKETTDKRMFVTFLALQFERNSGKIVLANAGHPPILHFHAVDKRVEVIRYPALPLGGVLNVKYEEHPLVSEPGDVLLLYTDGLHEAMNHNREEYGMTRLIKRFKHAAGQGLSAKAIVDVLVDDVRGFMGIEEQFDDITLMVMAMK